MSATQLDVVVVGGGIQGLLALNALVDKGLSCALVKDGDLGSGQTLHSHGYLNTGFGMSGPELPCAAAEVVQPYLQNRGVELSGDWVMIPPTGAPVFEGMPTAALPEGFAAPPGLKAVALPDRSISKRSLVEALSQDHRDRIIRGHAAPHMTGSRVEQFLSAWRQVERRSPSSPRPSSLRPGVAANGCCTASLARRSRPNRSSIAGST